MTEDISQLQLIRKDLKISREKLARQTKDLSIGTIRNAEYGRHRVTIDKAQQILSAVNSLLVARQKPVMTMDDLKLRLY